MIRPNLATHLLCAAFLALVTAVGLHVGPWLLPEASLHTLGLYLLFAIYALFLVTSSSVTRGRVALSVFWLVASLILALFTAPTTLLLSLSIGVVLFRTYFVHRHLLAVVPDAVITAAALLAAAFTAVHAGLAAAVWTLFLVQGFVVLLPSARGVEKNTFADAEHRAAKALHRLADQISQ